jgi:type VI secretion system protein ImpC
VRIALLGDFSGRAHRGELRIGDALARCKPLKLDVDTIDRVIAGFGTRLQIPLGAGSVALQPRSLDDLHPDALFDQLGVFAELARVRQRLGQPASFSAAVAEVQQWARPADWPAEPEPLHFARGNTVPVDGKLSDFARLTGRTSAPPSPPSAIEALVHHAIAPHLVQAASPQAPAWIAIVDQALSATMRELLHHPDFQCLEAAWRSLDFIARRVETDESLQVVVYDISAE